MEHPHRPARVRAPEPTGSDLRLRGLRGRFVLLHFFTSSCVNCLHVLDELRPLEAARRDVLTVIGVHSPKFAHETSPEALRTAIDRYGITHHVVADADLSLWRQYAIKAWPTLVLVDPEGYVVAQAAGEGHVAELGALIDELVPTYPVPTYPVPTYPVPTYPVPTYPVPTYPVPATPQPGHVVAREPVESCSPAGAVLLPADHTGRDADSLLVADTAGHRLIELTLDGRTVLREIGHGRGDPFTAPAGLTLLPHGLASYDILVADTGAHVLRGVRLSDGAVVETIDLAAAVAAARTVTGPVPAVLSPWDVVWWPALHRVVVAAAGVHLLLSLDLASGAVEVLAGTTVEGLRDGPALDGWLAQPSALAVDGHRLWFVDAETSALRVLSSDGVLSTAVGEGLFDFGLVDGAVADARMQHPLGVALLPDGTVAVADTFNGAIRVWLTGSGVLATLATGLAEPASVVVAGDQLIVVESAAGRITSLPLPEPVELPPGRVLLKAVLPVPAGQVPDDRDGPATRLHVRSSPVSVLTSGAGPGTEATRSLEVRGPGLVTVTAQLASCDDPSAESAACHVTRVERTFAVSLDPAAPDVLPW